MGKVTLAIKGRTREEREANLSKHYTPKTDEERRRLNMQLMDEAVSLWNFISHQSKSVRTCSM